MTTTAPAARTSWRAAARRFAELAATPLVPTDYLDLIAPLSSPEQLRAKVVAVEPETADAATLVLKPGRGWRGHVPGQYVRVGVDVDGVRQWRAYSLTSVRGDLLRITVKAIPDGVVSNHLVRRTSPGAVLQLDQAAGDFVLPAHAPAKTLFVTGGSGITPVMGMLRNTRIRDAVLVHSAPRPEDVCFADELAALHAEGRIRLVQLHTDTDGMLDLAGLQELVPDLAERETWACGPTGMLDLLEEGFLDLGLLERLHTERFRPSVLAVGEGGLATFGTTTVDAPGDRPLLDVGEDAGVLMPSGCRMGICYGCVLPLREGAVRDLRTGDLTTAAPGDGVLIQTCVSAAAGACDIDV
jgi:ferredoxin-NADP reductase